tara:strand:- start:8743 stop:9759 length:1017 start_codon:yes stop_codon:yes gene_type:complete
MEPNRKTLGQKVIEWMPSQHADRERAAEQERGLANLVDFIVPQTKSEVAMSLFPFGFFGRKFVRGAKELDKAYKTYQKKGGFNRRKFIESQLDENNPENLVNIVEDSRSYLKNWMDTYRGPNVEKTKEAMALQDINNIAVNVYKKLSKNDKGITFGTYTPQTNKVALNREVFSDDYMIKGFSEAEGIPPKMIAKSTLVHEFTHGIHHGMNQMLGRPMLALIKKALKQSQKTEGSNVGIGSRQYSVTAKKYYTMDEKKYNYVSKPTEVFATIMEMRTIFKEDPRTLAKGFVKLNKDLIKRSPQYAKLRGAFSHKEIENLYNNLPALVPLGLIGKNDKDK